ncbi:uncharacterized protein LY79DRAFT_102058 [Colletotrichum navitas]|uniref:Infection structure specific protein n=1 Tax=Colletotrichum navitas TaxID=681940 RepID=A0AAD8V7U1_9PEZI|nr:uncharacterized protein LY79DRAFT_102058 [Colletotrichum navitas]KAK1595578.1 hypothetical protein LY79DRAFT_102058 [Colletotrichum navitas]
MRAATALLGALAATMVAANDIHLNNIHKRIEPTKIVKVVEARGTPECTNAYKAFARAVTGSDPLPTPPFELEEWAVTADLATATVDPCATISVTGSIGAVYTSWSNSVESWQTAHMSEIRDFWHECTDIPAVSAEVKSLLESGNLCTSNLAAITSEPSNLAPRETGMAIAAAAAAGFAFAAMQ